MSEKLLIVMPTFNERENLPGIVSAILRMPLKDPPDILIVDDHSPDGTGQAADRLHKEYPQIHVLHRAEKKGLGRAYVAGLSWGLERSYPWIMEMDADFSHDAKYLPLIEDLIQQDRDDLLIGSRYVPGGGTRNWGLHRRALSRFGNIYARALLGVPLQDITGGFNVWRADVLRSIDLSTIASDGYVFQIELKYRAWRLGARMREFPIIFADRTVGTSKMTRQIALEAMLQTIRLRFR